MGLTDDYPELPDFLNRKLNGLASSGVPKTVRVKPQKLIWPRKRNWRKIAQQKREAAKREGAALMPLPRVRKGQ